MTHRPKTRGYTPSAVAGFARWWGQRNPIDTAPRDGRLLWLFTSSDQAEPVRGKYVAGGWRGPGPQAWDGKQETWLETERGEAIADPVAWAPHQAHAPPQSSHAP